MAKYITIILVLFFQSMGLASEKNSLEEALSCPYIYESVNIVTGEYCECKTDLQLAGPHGLTIKRCYNSNNDFNQGWGFNHPSFPVPSSRDLLFPENKKILYATDEQNRLKSISTAGDEGNKIYQSLTFDYKNEENSLSCFVKAKDGRQIHYEYIKNELTRLEDPYLLSHVVTPEGKEYFYSYQDHPVERSKLLSYYQESSGRYLYNEYYDSFANDVDGKIVMIDDLNRDMRLGRVKLQKAPVGHDETPIITSKFFYFDGYSEVFDALNRKTVYRYNKHNKLTAIENYQSNDALYRTERFYWDNEGNLISKAIIDDAGQALTCQTFHYNSHKNIIKHALYGNLSGSCRVPLILQSDGIPLDNGVESFNTIYSYSYDNIPKLLSHKDDKGKQTLYRYDPTSKQIAAILLCDGEAIQKRTFYSYDNEGRLVEQIEDDGINESSANLEGVHQRLIRRYILKETFPAIGMAEKIIESYLDISTGKEVIVRSIEVAYSEHGQIIRQDTYDANGIAVSSLSCEYDIFGNPLKTINEQGDIIETIYDSNGNLLCYEDAKKTIINFYDLMGRVVRSEEYRHSDGLHTTSTHKYDLLGNRIASLDMFGNETNFVYDEFGRLISTIYPETISSDGTCRAIESKGYNCLDQLISVTDPNGNKITTRYNSRGKPIEICYPDDSKETFVYFTNGELAKSTSRLGISTVYKRDYLDRPVKEETFSINGELINSISRTYDAFHLLSESDHMGNTIYYKYDGAGRLICSDFQYRDGHTQTELEYDAAGRLELQKKWFGTHPDAFSEMFAKRNKCGEIEKVGIKNSCGELLKEIDIKKDSSKEIKNTIFYSYNEVLRKFEVDSYGNQSVTTYDSLGRTQAIEKKNALGEILSYKEIRYNAVGNKTKEIHKVKDNENYVIEWIYSADNTLHKVIEASGSSLQTVTSYSYFPGGLIHQIVKPDGVCLKHKYNSAGRLSSLSSSDGSIHYIYSYDASGRVIQVKNLNTNQMTQRNYNSKGSILSETLENGLSIKNRYDEQDRRTLLELPDGSGVAYHYNAAYLTQVERLFADGTSGYTHAYSSHNLHGKLIEACFIKELGNIHYQYDHKDRCIAIQSPYWSQDIHYDSAGNIDVINTNDPIGDHCSTFSYNNVNQLIDEQGQFSNNYNYDSIQNITAKNQQTYEINPLNQIVKIGKSRYQYDNNGNLIQKDNKKFSYDALNRMISVTEENKIHVDYSYDPFHRRTSKTSYSWDETEQTWIKEDEQRFIYDGNNEIGCVDYDGNITELRILGKGAGAEIGAAIAIEINNRIFAPIHDHRGSAICLIDILSKAPVDCYHYSSFGDSCTFTLTDEVVSNPWQFLSKRMDIETGFVFFGKRYYDPSIGRWTTMDPLGTADGINRYAYVSNQPLTHIDLYGLYSISDFFGDLFDSFMAFHQFANQIVHKMRSQVSLEDSISTALLQIGENYIGSGMLKLAGGYPGYLETGFHGKGELNDKVRITLINGILNARFDIKNNINSISAMHGGNSIHYIFDATQGWGTDLLKGLLAKLGWVCPPAHALIESWRNLIKEMGGVDGGGLIIHYAHSIGSVHTKTALQLLSPEERSMIKVYTFGSPSMTDESNVMNYASYRDGVCLLDPINFVKGLLGLSDNIQMVGTWMGIPIIDHLLTNESYFGVLEGLGKEFLDLFFFQQK